MPSTESHSPVNIMKHLKGIHFPADKDQIVSHAGKAPGPDKDEVIETLKSIPDKQYHSPAEIMKEVGKLH